MSDIFKIGTSLNEKANLDYGTEYKKPNYENRYKWFISEFVSYNIDIPDDLKQEYNILFEMFGKTEQTKEISEQLKKFKVSVDDEVPMPEIVLSICGIGTSSYRDWETEIIS